MPALRRELDYTQLIHAKEDWMLFRSCLDNPDLPAEHRAVCQRRLERSRRRIDEAAADLDRQRRAMA